MSGPGGGKRKRQRLVQGRDYHGWAWKAGRTWTEPGKLFYWAEPTIPKVYDRPTETGRWVRVKFVEVK